MQLGHRAADCSSGTVNWRQIYGDNAFIYRPPQYWSEELAIRQSRKVDMADLEKRAREYAKVSICLPCAVHDMLPWCHALQPCYEKAGHVYLRLWQQAQAAAMSSTGSCTSLSNNADTHWLQPFVQCTDRTWQKRMDLIGRRFRRRQRSFTTRTPVSLSPGCLRQTCLMVGAFHSDVVWQ